MSLFGCFFFYFVGWYRKEFDESVRKKKLIEVVRIIEENNKDYLGFFVFEILFVWYCCEDIVKERSFLFLELIKYYDNRLVMIMI